MQEDVQRFMELVKTDEALQKKLAEAGKSYDGERTDEAVFHAVLEPLAKEAGFSFTLDDVKQSVRELNPDEMSQVAGGGGYGASIGGCAIIGGGIGGAGGYDESKDSYGGQLCILLGFGWGSTGCFGSGDIGSIRVSTSSNGPG